MNAIDSIRKNISKFFYLSSVGTLLISKKIFLSTDEKRVTPWFKIMGDKTLRLDYPLNKNSVVFDLGGYEGEWSAWIYAKYGSKIYIFEPVSSFAQNIKRMFAKNSDIKVFPFGLGNSTRNVTISLAANSSSSFKSSDKTELCKLVDVAEFMKKEKIRAIHLMKINIEGGEYEVLERLIESGLISRIKDIQVQFHDFVANAEKRRDSIRRKLSKTHRLTYDYPFVWENWRFKN